MTPPTTAVPSAAITEKSLSLFARTTVAITQPIAMTNSPTSRDCQTPHDCIEFTPNLASFRRLRSPRAVPLLATLGGDEEVVPVLVEVEVAVPRLTPALR